MRTINLLIKRLFDFFGSIIGIILLSPFFIIIILLIKLTSKGPIFYKQTRLGEKGEKFEIIKFRTMIIDADKTGDGLFVKNEKDSRITRVGKVLRTTSLDELPQLWNVMIGDMSLVGPRPPVPYHPFKYDDYTEFQQKRFKMKPGMTGLTQVTVRNSVPWSKRIPIDVKYVESFNLWLDIKILFKTIQKMFISESIYTQTEKKVR